MDKKEACDLPIVKGFKKLVISIIIEQCKGSLDDISFVCSVYSYSTNDIIKAIEANTKEGLLYLKSFAKLNYETIQHIFNTEYGDDNEQ